LIVVTNIFGIDFSEKIVSRSKSVSIKRVSMRPLKIAPDIEALINFLFYFIFLFGRAWVETTKSKILTHLDASKKK